METIASLPDRRTSAFATRAVQIRVRGRVQGVGFRPTVWRIAHGLGLDGDVRNDGQGVLIHLAGSTANIDAFRDCLAREPPPLARIESIQVTPHAGDLAPGFVIVESAGGDAHTEVSPDARICEACAGEICDPANRRFGYGLTNCTHCGPRLSIVQAIPYDRARTTMAPFAMCSACVAEYRDPADRRFHAEPIACPVCGPEVFCQALGEACTAAAGADPIAFAAQRLLAGEIIAIKGVGGYQLACDATNDEAVARLRAGKQRDGKPFALMARDLAVIERFAEVSALEVQVLSCSAAPIVLLQARPSHPLPDAVAPGLSMLGFMLSTSPLHVLLLRALDRPIVMTSGNLADEPQIIDDERALDQLAGVAAHVLWHDRAIASRIDDSVVRIMDGAPRLLRRARGYAPAPIPLPPGFADAPEILAMGGELKATFCLIKDGQAIISQHQGDLEHPAAFDDYRKALRLYGELFDHRPVAIIADAHPEYLSSKLARERREPMIEVQHHHAHIAACLCENDRPRDAAAVLGIALDGLGWGDDGTFWGGEILLADYRGYRRLAALKPVVMPGGVQAVREPWRNLYAHIDAAMGWAAFSTEFADLPATAMLAGKPLATLDAMIAGRLNAPLASSCGRLFDAAAAAIGLCADRQSYEGEAAARLEALAETGEAAAGGAYGLVLSDPDAAGLQVLDPAPLWRALFTDLAAGVCPATVARRFHKGLSQTLVTACTTLAKAHGTSTVALSGGCFQNRLLFESTATALRAAGLDVLSHRVVPANDGGLSLGQAAIGAARLIKAGERIAPCA
ncbi:MAG TPA: carbamoyltransferase HypF [Alphaproteobacteria bacterium]|nr:carbamoyltransferase HypF [Alphaproteobacteria bacterium]